ncbi:hypothetical protein Q669_29570 [Labrenzia sp. C1B10]|nr:hypothetical protein Q669_29570 [Labrenzia sp. C1B10]ERS05786.1 hypothetical protein Q675_29135 [Labrenzia sp. C1B70]
MRYRARPRRPIGTRQIFIMDLAKRQGFIKADTSLDQQVTLRLHENGLLRRDTKDAYTFYPR